MKKVFLFVIISIFFKTNGYCQLDNIIGKAGNLFNKGINSKIHKEPITTNFDDCNKSETLPPEFGEKAIEKQLCNIKFTAGKGYQLTPGYYTCTVKSFCLKAGTYAPSKGDGYLYAPLKGPKEKIVYKLIDNWYNHNEVDQHDLQLILWAIIAKTKISNLSPKLKAIVVLLIGEDDVKELSKVGLEMLSAEAFKRTVTNLPAPLQKIAEIENQMRTKFYAATVNYSEIESLAILNGTQTETSSIQRGTWTKLPNECYIKYLPQGYDNTQIIYYVPQTLASKEIYYYGTGTIAMPASIGSQRLAQSNKIVCN